MNSPTRIGLFGGSFDPVHQGHLHMADSALRQAGLDEIRFLPCRVSPHKTDAPPASGDHRLAMLRLALSSIPWAVIDDCELQRAGPSHSLDTAHHLRAKFPRASLFWILGHDQWLSLPRWHEPEKLAALVHFLVFARHGDPEPRPGYHMTALSGTHPASSSHIRETLATGSEPPADWLHPAVRSYLRDHGLYGFGHP